MTTAKKTKTLTITTPMVTHINRDAIFDGKFRSSSPDKMALILCSPDGILSVIGSPRRLTNSRNKFWFRVKSMYSLGTETKQNKTTTLNTPALNPLTHLDSLLGHRLIEDLLVHLVRVQHQHQLLRIQPCYVGCFDRSCRGPGLRVHHEKQDPCLLLRPVLQFD